MADLGVMIRFKSHPKDATIENKDSLLKGSKKLKATKNPKESQSYCLSEYCLYRKL
ncbi:MAG: hypothetical protein ACI9WL_000973 [Rubritalea sp.]|jgi:hypothetical protein